MGNSTTSSPDRRTDLEGADTVSEFISRAIVEKEKGKSTPSDGEQTKTNLDGKKRKIQHDDSPGMEARKLGSSRKKCRTEEHNQLADDSDNSESSILAKFNLAASEPILPFPRTLSLTFPALSPYLVDSSVSQLLTEEPLPVSLSVSYAASLVRFFQFVALPSTWDSRAGQNVYQDRYESSLARKIGKYLPDREEIRKSFPLGSLRLADSSQSLSQGDSIAGKRGITMEVVKWIWGQETSRDNLRRVIELTPLPLFAIVIEHVSIRRYLEAAECTRSRFRRFVSGSNPRRSPPRVLRAKPLVSWLETGGSKRWERFFGGSGSERIREGEEPWDWWFFDLDDQAEVKRERPLEELEEWERKEIEWENSRKK